MAKFDDPETEAIYQRNITLHRIDRRRRAVDNLLDFIQLCRPDPEDSENPKVSAFEITPLARLLAQILERVDRGKEKRICVSVGPQFGKSDVLSRYGPAWLSGKDPRRHMILGSYNDTFAQEFGGDVREIMNNKEFKQIFPRHALRKGSEAKDLLITTDGGKMAFVGVGGSGTGKPADIFNVDDPFKSDEDAQSALYREKVWKWFNGTVFSRCHKRSAVLVVHTRWHEDDLIGRLVDPDHPERNKKYKGIADRWTYYNLPAIIEDPALAHALGLELEVQKDPFIRAQFGDKPMVSLWENRKSLEFLAEAKQMDARTFGALYMGQPAPDGGSYFRDIDLVEEFDPSTLPRNLKKYGASDHAVSQKQTADSTVLGCVGIDEENDIWILPDIVWERMETDQTVDEIIGQMKTHKPEVWWMESELISKSFGPFLKRRMYEENVFTTLDPKTPTKEKKTRARSIQGRMRQRRVHFPAYAPWWPEAKQQLLKFPYGTHDDFVDWLSWIGLGLTQEYSAPKTKSAKVIETGTFAWLKSSANAVQRKDRIRKATQGW
jgi:predicted phage terminase large subunit-like protein